MSEFEKNEAMELNMEEMDQVAGGVNRFKTLTEKAGFIIYKVKKGDNLSRIANAHHCTVKDLLTWNPKITDKNQIFINEYLYIRA